MSEFLWLIWSQATTSISFESATRHVAYCELARQMWGSCQDQAIPAMPEPGELLCCRGQAYYRKGDYKSCQLSWGGWFYSSVFLLLLSRKGPWIILNMSLSFCVILWTFPTKTESADFKNKDKTSTPGDVQDGLRFKFDMFFLCRPSLASGESETQVPMMTSKVLCSMNPKVGPWVTRYQRVDCSHPNCLPLPRKQYRKNMEKNMKKTSNKWFSHWFRWW